MSEIENNWLTQSGERILYSHVLVNAVKKGALSVVGFEERGIPYEDVYRESSRKLAVENTKNFRERMKSPEDLREWGKQMTPPLGRETFGMGALESTEDCFSMNMHFCPHLKGWKELGLPNEMCAELCDLAMAGDLAMAEEMGYELENPTCLASGDCACRVIYRRKQSE